METDQDDKLTSEQRAKESRRKRSQRSTDVKGGKCADCGGKKDLERHHPDYDKDEVVILCKSCHTAADKKKKEKDAKHKNEADNVDIEDVAEDIEDSPDDTMVNAQRFDTIDAPRWMTQPFSRTVEGYLKGRAVITNTGVFIYRDSSGAERRELRLPEDVFNSDSITSLKMKPVTNSHPTETVTPENVKSHQVGTIGSNPSADGFSGAFFSEEDFKNGELPSTDRYHLSVDMMVTDELAIADILRGKRALSGGYHADIEETSGVWMGVPYDAIQRNIRYNHVAIVDRARAGDAAKIELRLDSADAVCVGSLARDRADNLSEEDTMGMKVVTLDGVEYQAEAKVIESLHAARKDLETRDTEIKDLTEKVSKQDELQAQLDTATDRVGVLEEEAKKLKDAPLDQTKIDEAVAAKTRLLAAAKKSGVEIADGMEDADVKRAVVLKVFPKADADKLKDASDAYLDARFDGAEEQLALSDDADIKNRGTLSDHSKDGGGEGEGHEDSDESADKAHADYIDGLTSNWDREDKSA